MTMGGPGDHPISDILHFNLPRYSSKIDNLIKEIAKYLPEYSIDTLMNWFSPPPLDEMEAILSQKLKELRASAQKDGWDVNF